MVGVSEAAGQLKERVCTSEAHGQQLPRDAFCGVVFSLSAQCFIERGGTSRVRNPNRQTSCLPDLGCRETSH